MQMLLNVVLAVQMLAALVMIGLVLIQHGKGADMGASFGSGSSGSLFGATGSANFLSRSTAIAAAIFFCCTLALVYFSSSRTAPEGGSVLDRAAEGASAPTQIPSAILAPASAVPTPASAVTAPAASDVPAAPAAASAAASMPAAAASQ
ncbi:MAG: preprotein translocase subunit SecG [Rhizobacter sp.]|jgi:preprotein translocase subunit SecG